MLHACCQSKKVTFRLISQRTNYTPADYVRDVGVSLCIHILCKATGVAPLQIQRCRPPDLACYFQCKRMCRYGMSARVLPCQSRHIAINARHGGDKLIDRPVVVLYFVFLKNNTYKIVI